MRVFTGRAVCCSPLGTSSEAVDARDTMVKTLHNVGVTSEMAYVAAFVSIGISVVSWWTSKNKESAGIDRADRWGIFVGQWAPTFFGLGNALKSYEK